MLFKDIPDSPGPRSLHLCLPRWVKGLLGCAVLNPAIRQDACQQEALVIFTAFIKEGLMSALLTGNVQGMEAYLVHHYGGRHWDNVLMANALSRYVRELMTFATEQWPDRPDILSNLTQGIAAFSQACQLPAPLFEEMVSRSQHYAIQHRYQIDLSSFQRNEMSLADANALLNQLRLHLIERVSDDENAVRHALLMPVVLAVITQMTDTLSQFAFAEDHARPLITAPEVIPMIAFLIDMPMETYYLGRDDVEQQAFDVFLTCVENITMALSQLHRLSGVDDDFLESCESLGAYFRCQCGTVHAFVERGERINLKTVTRITAQYQHFIQLLHDIHLDPGLLYPFVMDVARLQSVVIKHAYEKLAKLESDLLSKEKVIAASAERHQSTSRFYAIAESVGAHAEPMVITGVDMTVDPVKP